MPPNNNILRALQPLLRSSIRSTPVSRTGAITTPILLRSPSTPYSTTTTPPPIKPTEQQHIPPQTAAPSIPTSTATTTTSAPSPQANVNVNINATTPPSLRAYPSRTKTGTVISVGKMTHTVRVAHRHNVWDAHIRKHWPRETVYKVSDPRDSLREGDVVEFSSGAPKGRHVRHVVERIVAPFGSDVSERPAVMGREERERVREVKRAAKWERRSKSKRGAGAGAVEKEHVGRVRRLVAERVAAVKDADEAFKE